MHAQHSTLLDRIVEDNAQMDILRHASVLSQRVIVYAQPQLQGAVDNPVECVP